MTHKRQGRYSWYAASGTALAATLAMAATFLVPAISPSSAAATTTTTTVPTTTTTTRATTTTTRAPTTTTAVPGSNCSASVSGIAFDRAGWQASSNAPFISAYAPANALDGNLSTRFGTTEHQSPGLYFEVALGSAQVLDALAMASPNSPTDYARGYSVEVSTTGSSWATVANCTGTATPETVSFRAQVARYVKVVLTAGTTTDWWSIDEFNLYGGPVITSAASVSVLSGHHDSFTITTTGSPTPVLSESGALPPGLVFVANNNGTATISGSPPAGATGSYEVTITASNGVGSAAVQHLVLALGGAPVITSAASWSVVSGRYNAFTITTSGAPTPVLSESGALPPGLVFVANNNGTATISGSPPAGATGSYEVTISATNGVGSAAVQHLVLTLGTVPVITSAASWSVVPGHQDTFTITATGSPTPVLSESGALPPGLVFVANNNGSATISGSPPAGATGSYEVTVTATNGVGSPAVQHLVLTLIPSVVKKPPGREFVAVVSVPTGHGYYAVTSAGNVYNYGGAHFYGSTARLHLPAPVSAFALTADARGYWLADRAGDVYAFGDARVYSDLHVNTSTRPVVAIVAVLSGPGYYLVSSKGNVYNYGGAHFYGSKARVTLAHPIVAAALAKGGKGYYLVGSRGTVYNLGRAHVYGFRAGDQLGAPVSAFAVARNGAGYYLVTAKGNVYNYGDAHFYGSTARKHLPAPITGCALASDGKGYRLIDREGDIYPFGDAQT